MDGASNINGCGAGVVLEGPDDALLEQSLHFEFKASNNQAEYEALIAGMTLAKEMGAAELTAKSDSQLITGQVDGTFQTKDPQLGKYLNKVNELVNTFQSFKLTYVPREQNMRANLLSKLPSTKRPGNNRSVIQETLAKPSIEKGEVMFLEEETGSWMASKVIRVGYNWLTLKADCMESVKRCDKCQKHVNLHQAPPEVLHSIFSPWPFSMWGLDILGPFPLAPGQVSLNF